MEEILSIRKEADYDLES